MGKKKEKKIYLEEKLTKIPCETNINTVAEKHPSSENRLSGIVVNDEVLKYHEPFLKHTG